VDEALRCYRHPDRETYVSCADCGRGICPECMVYGPVGIRCPEHAGVGRARQPTARGFRRSPGQGALARVRALDTPATWALLTSNLVVYGITATQAADRGGGIDEPVTSPLWLDWVLSGFFIGIFDDWHRLVTSMFLHVGLLHLLCNMAGLWWLGSFVERSLGTLRFLLVYFVSGLAGSAGALIFDPLEFTAGASGAIVGIMAALVTMEWLRTRTLYTYGVAYIALLLVISYASDGLSFGGHLGGVVGGTLAALVLVQTRYRYRAAGAVLVVLMGVASVATAYVRVETYSYTAEAAPHATHSSHSPRTFMRATMLRSPPGQTASSSG
jgi:membrane associated rhomboid family serine protease